MQDLGSRVWRRTMGSVGFRVWGLGFPDGPRTQMMWL